MKPKRIFMIVSLVFTLTVNALANILPINGLTTGEVSDRYPVLFVPAGYVFSIWGLIYLVLVAFAIYSVTKKGMASEKIDSIAWWFVAANLFNGAWVFFWHYEQFPITLIIMLGLLASLIGIYLKLSIGKAKFILTEKLVVAAPFSIYLGWITVATVANAAQVLYVSGWRGGPISQPIWTVIMLLIAAALGAIMIFQRSEVAYTLVLTWAFVGIWVKQQGNTNLVAIAALILAILIAALALGRAFFYKPKKLENVNV
ncbi:MAG: tryptophan-rich sensory protein [Brevefilum sp.]|nr:tryptophan-rich sensory protein [Brevefilum sp.]MDW7754007.1 TspO/MBR family protein [Brevefilum sp.]